MISGELTLVDQAGPRVVKAGQSWTENAGYVHSVQNNGAGTARVAASYLIPKGVPRTTIIK